jgi:urease accessory protein
MSDTSTGVPESVCGTPGEALGPLLVTLQLTDSAFPSGLYTLSHGLEGYTQAGAVDAATLPALLADQLRHGVGCSDAPALALAHRAASAGNWETVAAVDRRLHATKLNREMRVASTRSGRQLLDVAQHVFGPAGVAPYLRTVGDRAAPGTQAVAAGVVHAATGVPVRHAVAAGLFAFCASFAGAALRLQLADHLGAQRLLRDVGPVIEEVAEAALAMELGDLGSTTFCVDIMSARHERAEARLFSS